MVFTSSVSPRYASEGSVTEGAKHQTFHIIAIGLQPQRRGQRQDRQFTGEDALGLFVSVHPRGELLKSSAFCSTSSNSRLHQWAKLVCEGNRRAAQQRPEKTVRIVTVRRPAGEREVMVLSISRASWKRPSTGMMITLTPICAISAWISSAVFSGLGFHACELVGTHSLRVRFFQPQRLQTSTSLLGIIFGNLSVVIVGPGGARQHRRRRLAVP